jgi:hypothetical protein
MHVVISFAFCGACSATPGALTGTVDPTADPRAVVADQAWR